MKKTLSFLFAIVFASVLPSLSFAWGKKGHEIVAGIASALLDSNTKQTVQKYLDTITFEHASVWMDEVRSDHKYDYMKPWHYVNIEKGKEYVETKDDNIINALNKAIGELEHRSDLTDSAVKRNLLIIFHLVGDLHMPLHAGYGADKGGNTIKVKYLDHDGNLHWIWDTEIIETEHITTEDCMTIVKHYKKKKLAKIGNIDVESWMYGSRSYLDNVYDFNNNVIDQAYADKNKEIIENQLATAGIRLAAVLEKMFKP